MPKFQTVKNKTNINPGLTNSEKQTLKVNKVRIKDLPDYALDEIEVLLGVTYERAREICALIEFQTIPSIGIKFAEDLISMGYYSISELKGKDGAGLTQDFESLKGYWIDPCVEDQFRLVVHYAETGDTTKNWWDFTAERKKFRLENGNSSNRPQRAWHETLDIKMKK
jgi:hypothetical protein